jgi:hypothetical protein
MTAEGSAPDEPARHSTLEHSTPVIVPSALSRPVAVGLILSPLILDDIVVRIATRCGYERKSPDCCFLLPE